MPSTFFSASIASSNPLRREFGKSICDETDRKSTRLNSSHTVISYAVFCLKKKKNNYVSTRPRLLLTHYTIRLTVTSLILKEACARAPPITYDLIEKLCLSRTLALLVSHSC